MYCAQAGELIKMPFGVLTQVDPRNHVLDGVQIGQIHLQLLELKISPVRDWRSTRTYCQLQSDVTQKLGQKYKKSGPDKL